MSPDLEAGALLATYRIERVIGRGGMGVVYLAEDVRLERRVAVKVLPTQLSTDESFRLRFTRESRMAAAIDHPNIIPVYDAGDVEGVLYIAMRFVEGTDLRELLIEGGPMAPDRAVAILRQVASALDAAHARGLVHRDVKPANILIASGSSMETQDHVYLTDFGLTKRTAQETHLTAAGQFVGTIDYVAPEQIEARDVDGRTDEYSLACVLYECLAGKVPYQSDSDVGVLMAHMSEPSPSLSAERPELPEAIDQVLARAMGKTKEERFPTCLEFIHEVRDILDTGAPAAPGFTAPPPPVATGPAAPAEATAPAGGTLSEEATVPGAIPPHEDAAGTAPPAPSPPPGMEPAAAEGDDPTMLGIASAGAPPEVRHTPPAFTPPESPAGGPGGGRRRVGLIAGIAALVVAAAVAGFILFKGGGGGGGNNGGPQLTHGRYQARLDSLASDLQAVQDLNGHNADNLVIGMEQIVPALRKDGTDLAGLNPPDDAAEANGLLANGLRGASDTLASSLAALKAGDFLKGDRLFQDLLSGNFDGREDLNAAFAKLKGAGYDAPLRLQVSPSPSASPSESTSPTGLGQVTCSGIPTSGTSGPAASGGQIFVMGADGTGVARLTQDTADDGGPAWKPDCSAIAFGSHVGNGADVFVMAPDGTGVKALTDNPAEDGGPDWSPDGTKIAFTSLRDGNRNIYMMDPNGDNETRVTGMPSSEVFPSWAADGQHIIFASDRNNNEFDLYVVGIQGKNVQRLTQDTFTEKDPSYSPDGSLIVFTRDDPSGARNVFVMDPSGENVTQLTTTTGQNVDPSWSPDGSHILFASDRNGDCDIFEMTADGQDQHRVVHLSGDERGPAFSPDGKFIAFTSGVSCA